MSIKVVRAIFESTLPGYLKTTLAVMATFGHDGKSIYASNERIARMAGKSTRRVRADITELVEMGPLVTVTNRAGGRGHKTTEFAIRLERLAAIKHGHQRPPFESGNTATSVHLSEKKPGHIEQETRTSGAENTDTSVRRSLDDRREIADQDPGARTERAPQVAARAALASAEHEALEQRATARGVTLRPFLFDEFKGQSGRQGDTAATYVHAFMAWALEMVEGYVLTEDPIKWWRGMWTLRHSAAHMERARPGSDWYADCPHEPKCDKKRTCQHRLEMDRERSSRATA